MQKLIILIFLGFISINSAQAGILIEPFLGYSQSTITSETIGGIPSADKSSGTGYGLRLGYKFMLPWVAIEYRLGSGEQISEFGTSNKINLEQTQMGVVAGVDIPFGFRVFAGYGFDNKLKVKFSTGDNTFKGTYTKLGIGMGILPMLKINLEYITNKYTKIVDDDGDEANVTAFYKKLDHNTVFLSLSVPLNL